MRKSRYTVDAPGPGGEVLLLNAANGAFAALSGDAAAAWEAAGAEPADSSPALGEDLARALLEAGFLADCSPQEELARQQAAFDAVRSDASVLTLSFVPTYACNFRCPYCYELGHNKIKGKMDGRVIDAVMDFVRFMHDRNGFGALSVQWYGGDPSLALDVVEDLSGRIIAWCDEQGVSYDAMMLTNANIIDEPEADIIARCRISSAFLTIDGPERIHNKRRVAANGSNSYERTIHAARLLRDRGLALFANMNADKVNLPLYADLRRELWEGEGIVLTVGKLNDYGHFFGEDRFCRPDFDLYNHEEFFQAQFREFARQAHDADELRGMLAPADRFCAGQLDNYFIVDVKGNVYRCDGWVGEEEHVRFSLFDDPSAWRLDDITFDATRDPKCSECEILPICQGNCHWERTCCGMPCHPLRSTMAGYLGVYRACFAEGEGARPVPGVRVFAAPSVGL